MASKQSRGEGRQVALYSLNVRGLRNVSKRNKMFNFLKDKCKGITFLQECHTTITDESIWKRSVEGQVFFSHGTSNARGTVTIIPKYVQFETLEVISDPNGRFVVVKGKLGDTEVNLINTYLPTQDKPKEQIQIIEQILPHIQNNIHNTIWGGDFNIYMSPNKDQYQNKEPRESETVKKMKNILEEWSMCDIWRALNPDKKEYTWRGSSAKGTRQSRLDYWFVPDGYIFKTTTCKILPSILTDHNIIELN